MPAEPSIEVPARLSDAYALLAAGPLVPIAGGTDIMVRITGEIGPVPERMIDLSRLQEAFLELGAAQCGICTPGMLMAARAYLDAGGGPDHDAIREGIAGNLCRCTGYQKIVEAIAAVAAGEVA